MKINTSTLKHLTHDNYEDFLTFYNLFKRRRPDYVAIYDMNQTDRNKLMAYLIAMEGYVSRSIKKITNTSLLTRNGEYVVWKLQKLETDFSYYLYTAKAINGGRWKCSKMRYCYLRIREKVRLLFKIKPRSKLNY